MEIKITKTSSSTQDQRLQELIDKLAEIRDEIEYLKEQEKKIKQEILSIFSENNITKASNDKLTVWKQTATSYKLDTKALKQDYPELYLKYAKEVTYEALFIRRKKKKEEELS